MSCDLPTNTIATSENPLHHIRKYFPLVMLCVVTLISSSGCVGYQVGNREMFRYDVTTVHVPVFQSDSLRRFLGERLTEAVVKEIELRTPYKVSTYESADSIINGRIISERKRTLSENRFDEPRNLLNNMRVEVVWANRNGQLLYPRQVIRIDDAANFIPEGGQSITTAQQETINRIAREIVNQMETPAI